MREPTLNNMTTGAVEIKHDATSATAAVHNEIKRNNRAKAMDSNKLSTSRKKSPYATRHQ